MKTEYFRIDENCWKLETIRSDRYRLTLHDGSTPLIYMFKTRERALYEMISYCATDADDFEGV